MRPASRLHPAGYDLSVRRLRLRRAPPQGRKHRTQMTGPTNPCHRDCSVSACARTAWTPCMWVAAPPASWALARLACMLAVALPRVDHASCDCPHLVSRVSVPSLPRGSHRVLRATHASQPRLHASSPSSAVVELILLLLLLEHVLKSSPIGLTARQLHLLTPQPAIPAARACPAAQNVTPPHWSGLLQAGSMELVGSAGSPQEWLGQAAGVPCWLVRQRLGSRRSTLVPSASLHSIPSHPLPSDQAAETTDGGSASSGSAREGRNTIGEMRPLPPRIFDGACVGCGKGCSLGETVRWPACLSQHSQDSKRCLFE